LAIFHGIFIGSPKKNPNIKFDIRHTAVDLMCRNPPSHLSQLKARTIPFNKAQSGQELCRPEYILHEMFIETPLHKAKFKYQSRYLTHCCGLEVQKPTQALKSLKGTDNTFDVNPKWARTLPSRIYFS
jgi:hypothetical protein